MSKVGSFFNFDVGDAADSDSIQIVAATGDVNQIRYMVSNRDLQIFTATGELYVPTYLNQAITPTNAQIRKQTPYGCEFVQPTSIDGATIFTEMGGKTVREYLYTDTEEAYTATSISTIASHLIDIPKYLAVVHSGFGLPDSYAAFTLSNGDMTLFSSNRAEKKASWTRVTTDGSFSSVCAIHNRLFANVYHDNNLHLCEFKEEIGIDSYVEASSKLLSLSQYIIILTGGSTTATVRLFGDFTGSVVGDKVHLSGFDGTNPIFDETAILNDTVQEITVANTTDVDISVTLPSAAGGSIVLTIDPATGRQVLTGAQFDVTGIYDAGSVVDVITKNNGVLNYAGQVTVFTVGSEKIADPRSAASYSSTSIERVYVGKSFTSKIVSNPVDASMGTGPATGEVRGITNVVIDVKATESMKVNSRPAISSSFTGKKEVRILGYNRNPQVTIEQDNPLPMQVNGLVAELIV